MNKRWRNFSVALLFLVPLAIAAFYAINVRQYVRLDCDEHSCLMKPYTHRQHYGYGYSLIQASTSANLEGDTLLYLKRRGGLYCISLSHCQYSMLAQPGDQISIQHHPLNVIMVISPGGSDTASYPYHQARFYFGQPQQELFNALKSGTFGGE